MSNGTDYIRRLRALSDAHAEDVLNLSDKEVDEVLHHCQPNAEATLDRLEKSLEVKIIQARKNRLSKAKLGLAEARLKSSTMTNRTLKLKTIADRIFSSFQASLPAGLTMAYREGTFTSEEDLQSLLEDLRDLGFDADEQGQ